MSAKAIKRETLNHCDLVDHVSDELKRAVRSCPPIEQRRAFDRLTQLLVENSRLRRSILATNEKRPFRTLHLECNNLGSANANGSKVNHGKPNIGGAK